MLLIGTQALTRTVQRGGFVCPTCRSRCDYWHRIQRIWLTIYFAPVVPIGPADEHVLCRACESRFAVDVITTQPAAWHHRCELDYRKRIIAAGIGLLRMSNDPAVVGGLCELTLEVVDHLGWSFDEVAEDRSIANPVSTSGNPASCIGDAYVRWSVQRRREAIAVLFRFAVVGGMTDDQVQAISRLARRFDLTTSECVELINHHHAAAHSC